MKKLKCIAEVLKPCVVATEMLCTEKFPSLSIIEPTVTALRKKHLVALAGDLPIQLKIKSAIKVKVEAHFSDLERQKVNLMAAYLDPRFKSLSFLVSMDGVALHSDILETAEELLESDYIAQLHHQQSVRGHQRKMHCWSIMHQVVVAAARTPPAHRQGVLLKRKSHSTTHMIRWSEMPFRLLGGQ